MYDTNELNIGFTIEDFDEASEEDIRVCDRCKKTYGASFWFTGKTLNSGVKGDEPVDYRGFIKTHSFNYCNCDKDENANAINEFKISDIEDFPFVEISCCPKQNPWNISFLGHCVLFNVYIKESEPS